MYGSEGSKTGVRCCSTNRRRSSRSRRSNIILLYAEVCAMVTPMFLLTDTVKPSLCSQSMFFILHINTAWLCHVPLGKGANCLWVEGSHPEHAIKTGRAVTPKAAQVRPLLPLQPSREPPCADSHHVPLDLCLVLISNKTEASKNKVWAQSRCGIH